MKIRNPFKDEQAVNDALEMYKQNLGGSTWILPRQLH